MSSRDIGKFTIFYCRILNSSLKMIGQVILISKCTILYCCINNFAIDNFTFLKNSCKIVSCWCFSINKWCIWNRAIYYLTRYIILSNQSIISNINSKNTIWKFISSKNICWYISNIISRFKEIRRRNWTWKIRVKILRELNRFRKLICAF